MRILILGGIAESKALAQQLIEDGHLVIYSLVGLVRMPQLSCEIHVGGFSNASNNGVDGLATYCREQKIELLVDATHPYAVEISANAVDAAKQAGIRCWRFSRPGWDADEYPNWHSYDEWPDLMAQIANYRRPFFTLGASIMQHVDQRPPSQQWITRSARALPARPGVTQINAIGPFYYADELALMREHQVDALISKDSGCSRVAEKLDAALALDIPVFVQCRPELKPASRSFDQIDDLVKAIVAKA